MFSVRVNATKVFGFFLVLFSLTNPAHAGALENLQTGFKSADSNETLLRTLAHDYPSQTKLFEIGQSSQKRPLLAILLTDQLDLSAHKPALFFNCAHHAVESLSVEYCYQILVDLLQPANDSWLKKYRFFVLPVVNPDGLIPGHLTRKNGNGVDLNRNYPFKWNTVPDGSSGDPESEYFRGKSPASEPETQAVMNLANQEKFIFSISFHTNATKVLVPYTIPGALDPTLNLGWDFAKLIEQHSVTHKNAITGKFQLSGTGMKTYKPVKRLYPVDGTDQDWHFWANGTLALLVEGPFANSQMGSYEVAKTVVHDFMPGFWKVLEHLDQRPKLLLKVSGPSGYPVSVPVSIKEFNHREGESFTTSASTGIFTFMFPCPGMYTLLLNGKEHLIEVKNGLRQLSFDSPTIL